MTSFLEENFDDVNFSQFVEMESVEDDLFPKDWLKNLFDKISNGLISVEEANELFCGCEEGDNTIFARYGEGVGAIVSFYKEEKKCRWRYVAHLEEGESELYLRSFKIDFGDLTFYMAERQMKPEEMAKNQEQLDDLGQPPSVSPPTNFPLMNGKAFDLTKMLPEGLEKQNFLEIRENSTEPRKKFYVDFSNAMPPHSTVSQTTVLVAVEDKSDDGSSWVPFFKLDEKMQLETITLYKCEEYRFDPNIEGETIELLKDTVDDNTEFARQIKGDLVSKPRIVDSGDKLEINVDGKLFRLDDEENFKSAVQQSISSPDGSYSEDESIEQVFDPAAIGKKQNLKLNSISPPRKIVLYTKFRHREKFALEENAGALFSDRRIKDSVMEMLKALKVGKVDGKQITMDDFLEKFKEEMLTRNLTTSTLGVVYASSHGVFIYINGDITFSRYHSTERTKQETLTGKNENGEDMQQFGFFQMSSKNQVGGFALGIQRPLFSSTLLDDKTSLAIDANTVPYLIYQYYRTEGKSDQLKEDSIPSVTSSYKNELQLVAEGSSQSSLGLSLDDFDPALFGELSSGLETKASSSSSSSSSADAGGAPSSSSSFDEPPVSKSDPSDGEDDSFAMMIDMANEKVAMEAAEKEAEEKAAQEEAEKAEEEARKKAVEEEEKKKAVEEEARKKAAEEEEKKKAAEDEARKAIADKRREEEAFEKEKNAQEYQTKTKINDLVALQEEYLENARQFTPAKYWKLVAEWVQKEVDIFKKLLRRVQGRAFGEDNPVSSEWWSNQKSNLENEQKPLDQEMKKEEKEHLEFLKNFEDSKPSFEQHLIQLEKTENVIKNLGDELANDAEKIQNFLRIIREKKNQVGELIKATEKVEESAKTNKMKIPIQTIRELSNARSALNGMQDVSLLDGESVGHKIYNAIAEQWNEKKLLNDAEEFENDMRKNSSGSSPSVDDPDSAESPIFPDTSGSPLKEALSTPSVKGSAVPFFSEDDSFDRFNEGLDDALDDSKLVFAPAPVIVVEKVGFTPIAPKIPLSQPVNTLESASRFSSQKAVSGPKNATVFLKNVERIFWKTRMSFQRVSNGAFSTFLFKDAPRVPFKGESSAIITYDGKSFEARLTRDENEKFVIYGGDDVRIIITKVSQFAFGRVQVQLNLQKEEEEEDEDQTLFNDI